MRRCILGTIMVISLAIGLTGFNGILIQASEVNQSDHIEQATESSRETMDVEETEATEKIYSTEIAEQENETDSAVQSDEMPHTEVSKDIGDYQTTKQIEDNEQYEKKSVEQAEESDVVEATLGITIAKTVDITTSNFTKELQDELNLAKNDKNNSYQITIPAGTYVIDKTLHIYSNTTLNMKGVTLKAGNTSGNMLMVGTTTMNTLDDQSYSRAAGYEGYENIKLLYGTWVGLDSNESCMVRFLHAKNITFDHVTFKGGGGKHQVEVCAIDGFYVRNCTFQDLTYQSKYKDNKREALQLDIPCSDSVFSVVYEDGTVMKNVYIENCTFSNVPRGVGTHTSLLGSYHENIYIKNNTFKNINEEAIVALDYYNCEISGNTIVNCGAGILVEHMKKNSSTIYTTTEDTSYKGTSNFRSDAKTTITNNTITTKYYADCDEIQAIKVYGRKLSSAEKDATGNKIAAGDYYISGVNISNNTITTAGRGIHLMDAKDCTITNNIIKGSGYSSKDERVAKKQYDGIFLEYASTECRISGNKISNILRDGIFLYNGSSASDLSSNTINSCKKHGIAISTKSKSTGDMQKNIIKASSGNGIFISDSSAAKSITNNTIKNSGGYGIGLWKNSTVTGAISHNSIQNCTSTGISISTGSIISGIVSNTIEKTKNTGINIYLKSTVKGDIRNNNLTDVKDSRPSISISTSSTVTGKIQNNKILKAANKYSANQGIQIYQNSTVKGAITGNTVKNTKGNAISISTSSKTAEITSNTIKSVTGSGIFAYKSSKISGDIAENKIDKTKASGIYLSDKVTVSGNIRSNTIVSPKQMGIFVNKNSTVKSLKKNTITGATSNAIDLASIKNNITISGNVIKDGLNNGILIRPGTTKYKVTITGNQILVKQNYCVIYVKNGKVSINKNTVSKKSQGIRLEYGVKGSSGKNTYK